MAAAPESTSNCVFAPFKTELMLAETPERSLILMILIGGCERAGPWSAVSAPLSFPIENHGPMSADPESPMVVRSAVVTAVVVVVVVAVGATVVEMVASDAARIVAAGVAATVQMC